MPWAPTPNFMKAGQPLPSPVHSAGRRVLFKAYKQAQLIGAPRSHGQSPGRLFHPAHNPTDVLTSNRKKKEDWKKKNLRRTKVWLCTRASLKPSIQTLQYNWVCSNIYSLHNAPWTRSPEHSSKESHLPRTAQWCELRTDNIMCTPLSKMKSMCVGQKRAFKKRVPEKESGWYV